jgi:Caspase domain
VSSLALSAVLALATTATPGGRVALLVSSEAGTSDEAPLRFTTSDAERLAAVLRELGGFAADDVHLLRNPNAAEVLDALDTLTRGPTAASVFFFYFSGHADAAALHPAGTLLPLDLLLHRLRSVPAELRIVLLDACGSGAAARAKGSRPAGPFEVRLDDQLPAGDILVSSSAADEQSFEGEHGGLFTLHWTAGLRGAADRNGDGQVTLSEAYEYAYAQTLRSTLGAATGPQHPAFRYELAGRRDPVLTQLAGAATVTLLAEGDGEYVVFDAQERSVIAEVPTRDGQPRRLALAPGAYLLKLRGLRSLRVARIQLAAGDDQVLREHQMQEVPLVRLSRKGSLGDRWATVSLGQYASGLGPAGQALASLGVEWEQSRWLFGADVGFSLGSEIHAGLVTQDLLLEVSATALYSLRLGVAALRFGPVLGVGWLRQAPAGCCTADGAGVLLGARVRLDVPVTQGLVLYALGDGRVLGVRLADAPMPPSVKLGGFGLLPWGTYQVGARVAF